MCPDVDGSHSEFLPLLLELWTLDLTLLLISAQTDFSYSADKTLLVPFSWMFITTLWPSSRNLFENYMCAQSRHSWANDGAANDAGDEISMERLQAAH